MAASRKLQLEIDRTLKKVQEGVELFDTTWNKVYDTENVNQKEKYETELKKEIKKLQRYRDQIKTWLQSTEIKDKKALTEARKVIEKEMERFKICEKETKTKAFSKEGLEQQPKADPKEKAKSETRDWLNNTVSELESQIDSFEAEMEGLFVKKGKTRPPRLTHLESSITRHKAHISKLELILRLLDNDGLSPEQVNDVKDFLDDYVERNQDDFDEFDDVDMLYSTLSLDKIESLEELVTIGLPVVVKGIGNTGAVSSIKSTVSTSSAQLPATVTTSVQQGDSVRESVNETSTPSKNSAISSFPSTSSGPTATPVASSASSSLSGPSSVKGISANSSSSVPPSPINSATKEAEISSFPVRKPSPALPEAGLRNFGRGSVTKPPSLTIPVTSGTIVSSSGSHGVSPVSETPKSTMLGGDEKLGSSGIVQPVVSSLSSRMVLPPGGKTSDAVSDGNNEAEGMTGRVFSPPSMPWRPVNPFQSQLEVPSGRPKIAPDHKENFLQKFQQVKQQTQGTLPDKQFTAQQNLLLKQFNSQSSAASPGMVGAPAASLTAATSAEQQSSSIHSESDSNTEVGHVKADASQQHQSHSGNSAMSFVPDKNIANEGDSKLSHTSDTQAGVSRSMTDPTQVTRDIGLSPGQPLQSNQSGSLGVIGRRSVSDLGAVGDSVSGLGFSIEPFHDLKTCEVLLQSSFYKLPQPKDYERPKRYISRNPSVTPPLYPQAQAPIVSKPAFWERLGSETVGTDALFFAFYYQQNTYQQYLAAKELKKQAWRYHKKYNTWFQRHEEPKVTTNDHEQGTYVYFDFHMGNNETQEGWCQRVKTDFKFEYNFLEDELVV